MLYSKRRKNLGRKKRSNRKSNRSNIFIMKGGGLSDYSEAVVLSRFETYIDKNKDTFDFYNTPSAFVGIIQRFIMDDYIPDADDPSGKIVSIIRVETVLVDNMNDILRRNIPEKKHECPPLSLSGGRRKSNRSNRFCMKGGDWLEVLDKTTILTAFRKYVDTNKNTFKQTNSTTDTRFDIILMFFECYRPADTYIVQIKTVLRILKAMYKMLDVVRNEHEQRRQKHYTVEKFELKTLNQLPENHFIVKQGMLFPTQIPVIIKKIESMHPDLMTDADKTEDANVVGKIGTVILDNDVPSTIMMPKEDSDQYIVRNYITRNIGACNYKDYSTLTIL